MTGISYWHQWPPEVVRPDGPFIRIDLDEIQARTQELARKVGLEDPERMAGGARE